MNLIYLELLLHTSTFIRLDTFFLLHLYLLSPFELLWIHFSAQNNLRLLVSDEPNIRYNILCISHLRKRILQHFVQTLVSLLFSGSSDR